MGLWGSVPVLVVLLITLSQGQVQGQGPDQAAMEAIRKGFSRPPTAWKGSKYCEWTDTAPNSKVSVNCDSGKVTEIFVKDQKVGGYLDPAIGNLTSLARLHIYNNGLTGDFPTLKGLSSLKEVLANDNNFSSFPPDLFSGLSGLTMFCINNNQFANWQIPESVKDMSSMAEFRARNVGITGNLPDYFNTTYMPSLEFLELNSNKLQGYLPASFAGSGIQNISLSNNNLSGSLDVLNNMTGLQVVDLNMNNFTGPLPDVSNLKGLLSIDVRDNNFITGVIPPSWLALMNNSRTNVTLGNNALQGPMPKADPVRVKVDGLNSFCTPQPGEKCDPRVDILLLIAKDMGYPFILADNWKDNDPCINSWKGTVTCSGGNITRINFGKLGSAGTISTHYSELTYLTDVRLNNNNLTGTIPVELTKLSSLKYLDLSYNQLYGKVPSFRPDVVVKLDGNPDIGKDHPSTGPGAPTGSNGGGNKTGLIVGIVVGCVVGLLVVGFLAFCLLKRKKRPFAKVRRPNSLVIHPRHSGDQNAVKITVAERFDGNVVGSNNGSTSYGPNDIHVEAGNMIISIQVLRSVTKNFNEDKILGKGGFGTVYEGEMHDGTKIAVKRMESGVVADKGLNEFKAEIAVLTKVRHRHLVGLLGYCLDGNEKLLVYEHMPQGTLSRHLFNWKEEGLEPLDWTRRLSIALDVARGVEYLHGLANETFIHRDLKPSNILLGDDMRAKVSDFGLVRLAPAGKGSIETRLAGTFGYLAPEYAATGRMTVKVDVYSFGVILMELITGRKAIDESQPEESCHLVTWFRRNLIKKDALIEIIDPTIDVNEETLPSITTVAELAGHCSVREPYQRPEMGHAVNVLSSLVSHWKPSKDEETDDYAIDFDVPLNEVLKKWMNSEGKTNMDESSLSSVFLSEENSQTSIPPRPKGLLETLGESDAR